MLLRQLRKESDCTGILRSCALSVVVKPNPAMTDNKALAGTHKDSTWDVLVGNQKEYPDVPVCSNNLEDANQMTDVKEHKGVKAHIIIPNPQVNGSFKAAQNSFHENVSSDCLAAFGGRRETRNPPSSGVRN